MPDSIFMDADVGCPECDATGESDDGHICDRCNGVGYLPPSELRGEGMAKKFQLTGTSPDGKARSVWCCGGCMKTCVDEVHATRCCVPLSGRVCDAPTTGSYLDCDDCRAKERAAKNKAMYDRAPKIHIDDYKEEEVVFDGDEHQTEVGEWLDLPEDERPEWAWAIVQQTTPPFKLDARSILEGPTDNLFEDAVESLDVVGLQKVLDDWVAAQQVHWWLQTKTIVVLDRDEVDRTR